LPLTLAAENFSVTYTLPLAGIMRLVKSGLF
jgi:hypothetical protein